MKKLLLSLLTLITFSAFSQITSPYNTFVGCKPTSITLKAPSGYHKYLWSTGETTSQIEYVLLGSGSAIPDTATVGLTCYDQAYNAYPQTPVMVRSIREPQLLSNFNKKYNYLMTDSIKCELVVTYQYTPQYVFTFIQTDTRKPGQVKTSKYVSDNRWCPLDKVTPALEQGKYYHVTVHARVNNINYCKGNYGEIGLKKVCSESNDDDKVIYTDPIDFELYPNPATESSRLIVDSDDKLPMNIKIYDTTGKVIYNYDFDSFPINEQIGNYLPNGGTYKVVMMQGNNVKTTTLEKL
jgi:outer membrane lipoprotein-sorting protein